MAHERQLCACRAEEYNSAYRNVHFGSVHGTVNDSTRFIAGAIGYRDDEVAASIVRSGDKLRGIEYFTKRGGAGADR